jgi:3-hydroxyisobutyrate dehydrogenase
MKAHFIGVGKMGLPMALRLMQAGHDVSVSDIDLKRCKLAKAQGLKVVLDGEKAMNDVAVVFSSLPDDAALLAAAERVARHVHTGCIWVDTSTVSMQASAEAAVRVHAVGVEYLRCTISGNNHMAEAAQLTVMASGQRPVFDEVQPLLRCFGPHLFYLGDAEQSRLMKLVVNLMIAQTSAMLAEALTLGQKGGLDWSDMWQVLSTSAVASPIVKAKAKELVQRDFSPTFTCTQMLKDLSLILAAGRDFQAPLNQTSLTYQLMVSAIGQGHAEQDYASIIRSVERSASLK